MLHSTRISKVENKTSKLFSLTEPPNCSTLLRICPNSKSYFRKLPKLSCNWIGEFYREERFRMVRTLWQNLYLWGSEQTGLHRFRRRRGGSRRAGCRRWPRCSTRPPPSRKASVPGPRGRHSRGCRRPWPSHRSPPSWRDRSHWSWSCSQGQGCNIMD